MKKILQITILMLIPLAINFGQISITQSDFNSIINIGATQTSFGDTVTNSLNIGEPGGNNNWNFMDLIPHTMLTGQYVDPSTTPFAGDFPGANVASYFTFESTLDDTTTLTSESWSYFSNTESINYGSAVNSTTTTPSTSDLFTSITTHIPPFAEYDFPIEFNKVWSREDSTMTQSLNNGIPIFTSTESSAHNFHIDAWGTMIMPSGKTVDALRSREQSITTSYIIPGFSQTFTSVHYVFMGKGGESVSIFADSENPATSGIITGSVAWGNDDVTSVEKLDDVPKEFHLSQNYPNPFNPTTKIEYSITKPSVVKLNVYDILGNEVAALVNESQSAGNYRYTFNGTNLTSGIYFIQIQAGENVDVKKMTLMK